MGLGVRTSLIIYLKSWSESMALVGNPAAVRYKNKDTKLKKKRSSECLFQWRNVTCNELISLTF
jgi:hypothetical protein